MMLRRSAVPAVAALVVVALAGGPPARAQDAVLLHGEAGGVLELEGERRLEVAGLAGNLVFREGKAGELQYAARTLDNRRVELPVELWLRESTLLLRPLDGVDEPRALIEVAVPPGMATIVETSDGAVSASGLSGRFELSGAGVELQARGMKGPIEIELAGGSVLVSGSEDEIDLSGKGLNVKLLTVDGPVLLDLEESVLELSGLAGATDAALRSTSVVGQNVSAALRLDVDAGSVELLAATGGGLFELSDTPLTLNQTKGEFEVSTNSRVDFEGHDGTLKIEGYGAAVFGEGAQGVLAIETDNAALELRSLNGEHSVRGHGLQLKVSNTRGTLEIVASASNIVVENCFSTLRVENEFGDVEIHQATHATEVTSRDGSVRLIDFKGTLQLQAEGPLVEVDWTELGRPEPSVVENRSGDLRVGIPAGTSLRVDAEAPHGEIQTDIEDVRVSDDGHFASGQLFHAANTPHVKKPTLELRSGSGDLYLYTSASGR